MEHSLHVAAKHFVKAVAPSSPTSIQRKVKAALTKAWDDGQLDPDQFDEALAALAPDDGDNDGDNDDEIEFTPGDSLGKALALVKQVQYLLRFTIFTNLASDSDVPPSTVIFQIVVQSGGDQTP